MAAENRAMRKKCHPAPNGLTIWTCFIFRTKCDFLSPLRRQFSGLRDGLLKPNVSNPFSPYFFIKEKMGVREKEGAENYLMKTTWPSVILKPLQEEDLHPWRSKEQWGCCEDGLDSMVSRASGTERWEVRKS